MVDHAFIENEEIHIKIDGDHGLSSYKESFQVCNTKNPNSKENTIVFNFFQAKDKKANLKTALLQYKTEMQDLQLSQWRYV